jgi:hypothetical protein
LVLCDSLFSQEKGTMMKRILIGLSLAVLVVGVFAISATRGAEQGGMDHPGRMGGKKKMGKGMGGSMPMMGMMGGMGMGHKQMVATQDGGIVVSMGNMLIKYDKDLELVKKTTIEISDEEMQGMMKKMKSRCVMMQKMMDDKDMDEKK